MTSRIRRRPDEDGSAAVEMAVLAPLALLLILSTVQAGLWWHTRTLCLHAAQQAATAARTLTGSPSQATAAARSFLDRAPGTTDAPEIHVDSSARDVVVRVAATAPVIVPVPGLVLRVEQTAGAAKERFTTPEERE